MSLSTRTLSIVVLAAVIVVGIEATDLLDGYRQPGDKLACFSNVHLPALGRNRIVTATRTCSGLQYRDLITNIEARDLGGLGRGGHATITSGGIHNRFVTIYMWSQPGQPLDFSINVHAKKF